MGYGVEDKIQEQQRTSAAVRRATRGKREINLLERGVGQSDNDTYIKGKRMNQQSEVASPGEP